jgi:hypothetical protein
MKFKREMKFKEEIEEIDMKEEIDMEGEIDMKEEIDMEEEKNNIKSLDKKHIIGINNLFLPRDVIDEIWCDDDDTL